MLTVSILEDYEELSLGGSNSEPDSPTYHKDSQCPAQLKPLFPSSTHDKDNLNFTKTTLSPTSTTPSINMKKRVVPSKRNSEHTGRLYLKYKNSEQKRLSKQLKREQEEREECPFSPRLHNAHCSLRVLPEFLSGQLASLPQARKHIETLRAQNSLKARLSSQRHSHLSRGTKKILAQVGYPISPKSPLVLFPNLK